MKKVLITGANSYIGTSFEKWVCDYCLDWLTVDTVDMIDGSWRNRDFSSYDSIFHVAGIAHADVGKVTEEQKQLYYKINTELTVECAQKAKKEGVKQFVFMSSIIVYGECARMGEKRVITKETPLAPANFYGDSKVKAEEGILKLVDNSFKVVVLRPPMIYGKGSKGNYPLLAKMARKLPVFPDVQNERSMLYIGNLCKFISLMIERDENGIFFPQNREYVRTSNIVNAIAAVHNKKIIMVKFVNPLLKSLGKGNGRSGKLISKAFGNIVYEKQMSSYREDYQIYTFEQSVSMAEE